MKREAEYDVAIIGGGLAGASLAVALAPGGKRIALIEAVPFRQAEPEWDERTIALNAASRRIFENLGVWQAMRPDAGPILATHISERGRFGVARFTAKEAGEEALGYNMPMRAIGAALWRSLKSAPNVELICPAQLMTLDVQATHVALGLDNEKRLSAKLVVAADGAQSKVRKLLGIGASLRDYGQTAVLSTVKPERPHQGIAYERFTEDGPIAVLPRPGRHCALVWTVPTGKAAGMLAWSDREFLENLHEAFGHRLGRFLQCGRRQGYPLAQVISDRLTAKRVIFAGNAAQTLHPVAAQGFNLGLRDVATVAELLAGEGDPGAPELLAEYESRRAVEREKVAGFTDQLVRMFSNAVPGLSEARHLGLLALDLLPPIKAAVMRQNLGYAGATPELARAHTSR
ncbi:MAG: 2-octaprenyl-6-methoxyphenyl hydroxylase [Hydrocarboniphaga effusa]|nr:2-octaprenyl-6-methoxyphenyl hydroxylase [Hydrocarboniphaga effusa]